MQKTKVKVLEVQSQKVLFEIDIDQQELAYEKAAEYEEMGISVEVIAPGLPQTLTNALNLNPQELEEYEKSVIAEIEDHDFGCCAEDSDSPIKH